MKLKVVTKAAAPDLLVDKSPTEEIWWFSSQKIGFVIVCGGVATSIVVKKENEGPTARGLSVGDSRDKAFDLYGTPQIEVAGKYWYTAPDGSFSLMLMFGPDQTVSSITLTVGTPSK